MTSSPRTAAGAALAVVAVVGGAIAVWQARHLLLLAMVGVIFGLLLAGAADLLGRWRVPRPLAILLVLALLAGGFWLVGRGVGPTIVDQARQLEDQLPRALERLERWIAGTFGPAAVPAVLEDLADRSELTLPKRLAGELDQVLPRLLTIFTSVLGAVAGTLLVLVVAVFTAASPELYREGVVVLFPERSRAKARAVLAEVAGIWRRWVGAQLVSMLIVGVITGVALALLGVPSALALAVIAGLAEFIPVFGPILAALPAIGVAFVESPRMALWVALTYLLIQQLESNVVTPIVMRHGVLVPPLVMVVGAALLALSTGFVGMLVAAPLLAAVLTVVRETGRPGFLLDSGPPR